MKKILFAVAICIAITAATQAQKPDPWTVYMTPDTIHDMLSEYAGEFNMEITMWMTAGKAPEVVNVNSSHKMILGNRFLEMTQSGDMMGMAYHSLSTIGFNTISKSLSLTTLTNMGTGTLYLKGSWDAKNKIAILKGEITNPLDNTQITVRQKITFIDKNNLLVENFDRYKGQAEKKSMQYKLVRK